MLVPFIRRMSGRANRANRFSGPATNRPMPSLDCRAASFGICSPKTTCRKVMRASVSITDRVRVTGPCQSAGRDENSGREQGRQGRLADEPEGQTGDGDAELGGRDAVVQIVHGRQQFRRPRLPLVDEFLDPTAAEGDEGELGPDEEGVDQNQKRKSQSDPQ